MMETEAPPSSSSVETPAEPLHPSDNNSQRKLTLPLIPPKTGSDATPIIVTSADNPLPPSVVHSKPHRRASGGNSLSSSAGGTTGPTTRLRVYKSKNSTTNKWVTREIAALEFLLGIPLQAERDIVHQGWMQQQGIVLEPSNQPNKVDDVLALPTENSQHSSSLSTNASHHGRWWEKWINNPNPHYRDPISGRSRIEEEELEQPPDIGDSRGTNIKGTTPHQPHQVVPVVHAPGRRLEGDEATQIQIPLTVDTSVITRQKSIALMAVTREWELRVAHGIGSNSTLNAVKGSKNTAPSSKQVHPPMLDGRLFFSSSGSYPIQVFSLLRYEPKKEEAARRRQKLEARGGGGTQFFIMPIRDWRGITYRALLPRRHPHQRHLKQNESLRFFDRFATTSSVDVLLSRKSTQDDTTKSQGGELLKFEDDEDYGDEDDSDEEEDDTYVTGLLDDPEMVQGRHRNVMIGYRVTGPIVSSTIQFVKPQLLKAELNKQFRERFDGWEPPKSQRKYIGARVIDGIYTVLDPGTAGEDGAVGTTDEVSLQATVNANTIGSITSPTARKRQGSVSSLSTSADAKETIRMPPSLTLSKIRSVKQQALVAAVKAKLEISTVALAIVYFERLCLDCRVDKTNRRLSFAACLLLAIKINEAHVELVIAKLEEEDKTENRIQSLIRPTKKSNTMFASLLEFFTQDWNISLKHLFAAEWGVFAALQFRLHAKPSHVAFHFKRLLKSLTWNPRRYVGDEMYSQWQQALAREEYIRIEREARREVRQQKKEEKKLVQLQRELDASNRREKSTSSGSHDENEMDNERISDYLARSKKSSGDKNRGLDYPLGGLGNSKKASRIGGILNRFSVKRAMSTERLSQEQRQTEDNIASPLRMPTSPSMPALSRPLSAAAFDDDFAIDIHGGPSGDVNDDDIDSTRSVLGSDDGAIMI